VAAIDVKITINKVEEWDEFHDENDPKHKKLLKELKQDLVDTLRGQLVLEDLDIELTIVE